MRKTIIALILVLPMVFVLVVFSSAKLVSLGVSISVNGIRVYAEGAEYDAESDKSTLLIDMADGQKHSVAAEVSPANASVKTYKFRSSDEAVVTVAADGSLEPHREGTATVTAVSDDKNFTDALDVVIVSSKPYRFDFSLFRTADENVLEETETGYAASVETGTFAYDMKIEPLDFTEYAISAADPEAAIVDKGGRTVFLPFSGKTSLDVSVPGGVGGTLEKTVALDVKQPASSTGILVNGSADGGVVLLEKGATEAKVYVESRTLPTFQSTRATAEAKRISSGGGRYLLSVAIDPDFDGEELEGTITASGKSAKVVFSFRDFDFRIASDMPAEELEDGRTAVSVLKGSAVSFYAVTAMNSVGIEYEWTLSGGNAGDLSVAASKTSASVNASKTGDFVLSVKAKRGAETLAEREIVIHAVSKVSAIQIANNTKVDLAERYTVAGLKYGQDGVSLVDNAYALNVFAFTASSGLQKGGDDLDYAVSDQSIAKIEHSGENVSLVPLGTGKVTVTVSWKGNAAFHTNVSAVINLNVVKDAVAVKNAPELTRATEDGKAVVLTENIKLGTDASGAVLSKEERAGMFKKMKSTYNIEWYKETKDAGFSEDSAYISYVMEFKNDVYGNGKSIDADNFTHALDGSGVPLFAEYRGPLYFVNYKNGAASVAGQDNAAFLIRTDGVKLYGVNLLGCSDDSLLSESGGYDLSNLNLTGTTLEINADADLVNCRIRNGRNVIRAYGGNRNGDNYFLDTLTSYKQTNGCESERLNLNIEGCILAQGREFILKIGANRALRASWQNGAEPSLTDQSGKAYAEQGNTNNYGDLYKDDYFYKMYVMTDVTLKNSVLETSGLFTVGIESNFAGDLLYAGAKSNYSAATPEWRKSGGTSFASVLRLEGDVRLYDWKDISLIDSSTLIESSVGALAGWLKLDVQKMIDYVYQTNKEKYGDLIEEVHEGSETKQFAHGGIAFYGGGKNYGCLDKSGLKAELSDLGHFNINIGVLSGAEDQSMQTQGNLLPTAAGTHDFNFYMYGSKSPNNYEKQRADEAGGLKYKQVGPVSLF